MEDLVKCEGCGRRCHIEDIHCIPLDPSDTDTEWRWLCTPCKTIEEHFPEPAKGR